MTFSNFTKSISAAVDFCLNQSDEGRKELWPELISLAIGKPEHIKDLLKKVGNYVDPWKIIEKIPQGMEIPELRDTLQLQSFIYKYY